MTNALVKSDPKLPTNVEDLDILIDKIRNIDDNLRDFQKSLYIASYLEQIHSLIPAETIKLCRNLMNKGIGFKTDRKDYDDNTLRDCIVQAMIHKFRVHGNEFNILGGNFYATKEGLERVVNTYPTLKSEPEIEIRGATQSKESKNWKFVFSYKLEFKDGTEENGQKTLIISGTTGKNNYETPYASVEGKATRKLLNYLYNKLNRNFALKDTDDLSDSDFEPEKKKSKVSQLVESKN